MTKNPLPWNRIVPILLEVFLTILGQLIAIPNVKEIGDMELLITLIRILLIASCVGAGTYILFHFGKKYMDDVLRQYEIDRLTEIRELRQRVEGLESAVKSINDKIFVHDVISYERVPVIHEARNFKNHPDVNRITDEIYRVRENFRLNMETYGVSLDVVEFQLKRMYGVYYDGKKQTP